MEAAEEISSQSPDEGKQVSGGSRPMNLEGEDVASHQSSSSEGDSRTSSTVMKKRKEKTTELPIIERRNWLIHHLYIKQEFETCRELIKEQLAETHGLCEYALYIKGLLLRHSGQIQESLETFQTCCMIQPNNVSYLKQVARSLYLVGKHKVALDVYREAANHKLTDWEIQHHTGLCYLRLDQYGEAEVHLKQALEIQPNANTFKALGMLYLKRGDDELAQELFRTAVSMFPENSQLLNMLGSLYMKRGRSNQAFEMFGNALTFDVTDTESVFGAASLMQDFNDYDVALTKYRVAANQVPDSGQLWNNVGMCFFGKKKYVAAISCMKRAIYLNPFEFTPLYNLGLVHINMQQYASAFHYLSAAANIKPKEAKTYILLALALTHLDDISNASHAYQRAMELDEHGVLPALNYCIFLCNHGDENVGNLADAYETLKTRVEAAQPLDKEVDKEVYEVMNKLTNHLNVSGSSHVEGL